MRKYLNASNLPLSLAVWLATDNYDYDDQTISATQLIRSVRQIVLGSRVSMEETVSDISNLIKSRMGTAVHDSIERAWLNNYEKAMKNLGYPDHIIEKVKINPDPKTVKQDDFPIYIEKREYKQIRGFTISGKFDFLSEGRLEDFKNTSTYAWNLSQKTDTFRLQASIYRWLNPEIVTAPEVSIQYIFSDFQPMKTKTDKNYPDSQIKTKNISLLSVQDTEQYIANKLDQVSHYWDSPESEIPFCSDDDLWRKDPHWKYYKNPEKTTRSTKNFTIENYGSAASAQNAAYQRLAEDKHIGKVVEVPGEVVACKYCEAFPICSQKDQLIADGSLKI